MTAEQKKAIAKLRYRTAAIKSVYTLPDGVSVGVGYETERLSRDKTVVLDKRGQKLGVSEVAWIYRNAADDVAGRVRGDGTKHAPSAAAVRWWSQGRGICEARA